MFRRSHDSANSGSGTLIRTGAEPKPAVTSPPTNPTVISTSRTPLLLLLLWLVINLLQAAFTPLDPDETYYWMYAGRLDWGYFDHPPAVAVLISLGKHWLPGALGLRFGHVLASTATIAGMWLLLGKPTGKWLVLAAALVFAQPFLHVYGFIATPDGPLLLFTVLYLLAYRRFLRVPSLLNGALWGVTMAGLLYSKYHGVMLIFFSVLPQLFWLLRQPGAWVAAMGGALLYVPHLYWQYANDFPSFRYHLSGRNDAYRFKYTTQYILNQLLIFSPLLVWFYGRMLYHYRSLFRFATTFGGRARPQVQPPPPPAATAPRRGSSDEEAMSADVTDYGHPHGSSPQGGSEAERADRAFLRANYWLIGGFLIFFLYSTTKGGTEAQWTALLSMPLCYLTFRWAKDHFPDSLPNLRKLGFTTLAILLVARLLLMAPREWLPFEKPFDHEPWAKELQEKAGDLPVMVQNSYRFSSLYEFYTGQPAWTFTDVQYRLNQYDLWTADSVFHNQPVYLLGQGSWDRPTAEPFRTQKRNMLTQRIDSFQVMTGLQLAPRNAFPDTLKRGELYKLTLVTQAPRQKIFLDAGNLPLAPFITIHYAEEEMRFWQLERGITASQIVTGHPTAVFLGSFRTFNDSPLGPVEIEFGLGYAGMPPLRGQSQRYPVVIVE